MSDDWANFVANWATDRGLCRTEMLVRLLGTPLWIEAKTRHASGASVTVCRMLLDHALSHTGMAPQKPD